MYGLIGEKLGHSFSPFIHSLIFKQMKIEGHYDLFEVNENDLEKAIIGLKALGAKGVNVTIPYKVNVMKYLDDISKEAKKIGAINTICFKDGKCIGYNTDYYGFGMMLKRNGININNKKAVILGTGGASKAVCQYLIDNDAREIIFVSRNKNRKLDNKYELIDYEDIKEIDGDIMINCTPCGMYPNIDKSPVEIKNLESFNAVVDLIYNPKETLFIKYAKKIGIKNVNGLYMLVGQAIKAQELWQEICIDTEIYDIVYQETYKKLYK